ncbi:MAG: permease-like cell division protein FtsX [Deltaproteobacteria bacterium]|nr:permease-like cell division protein FtsX [Deltaproteobacteria bacterium]
MRGYFVKQAWLNLTQNPWMNALALGTITCSFLILGLILVIYINTQGLIEEWGGRIRVTVYLQDSVSPEQINRLKENIQEFPEVREVQYRSKADALKELEEKLRGQKGLLKGLPRNPLPASFLIQLKPEFQNADGVQSLVARMPKGPEIEDLQSGGEWVERFSAFMAFFQVLALSLGGIFLIATMLVISNTMRMNIFARREEIEIMRLVGATGFFIRAPFYVEGVFQGFLGACLALVLLYGFFQLFLAGIYEPFQELLGNFPLHFLPEEQIAAVALGGIFLGFLGTQVSVGRYLRA